jgi:hypothetical protein
MKEAFKHVKQFFPTLSIVIFNKEGQWSYMDDNFNSFNFEGAGIDQSILEDASNEIKTLPFIYQE